MGIGCVILRARYGVPGVTPEPSRELNMQEDNDDISRSPEVATDEAQDMELMQELEAMQARLDEAEATIAQLQDSQLRERAEIENRRRRMARELEDARRFANQRLLGELLPVCDSLERGLAVEHTDSDGVLEGMALTLKALLKVMRDHGLEQIDPLGEAFDPERHEAMAMVEPPAGQAPNTVVQVVEKGYVLNERLLRPARVVVTRDA